MQNYIDILILSKKISCSVSFIRKLIHNKEIPYIKLGRKILFSEKEIDDWLVNHEKK